MGECIPRSYGPANKSGGALNLLPPVLWGRIKVGAGGWIALHEHTQLASRGAPTLTLPQSTGGGEELEMAEYSELAGYIGRPKRYARRLRPWIHRCRGAGPRHRPAPDIEDDRLAGPVEPGPGPNRTANARCGMRETQSAGNARRYPSNWPVLSESRVPGRFENPSRRKRDGDNRLCLPANPIALEEPVNRDISWCRSPLLVCSILRCAMDGVNAFAVETSWRPFGAAATRVALWFLLQLDNPPARV